MAYILNDLLSTIGPMVNWEQSTTAVQTANTKEVLYKFTLMMYGVFSITGIPLIIFILSLIGLSIKDN